MIDFIVERERCTQCGECVADCPARIISMEGGYPVIAAEREGGCYRCQHCLAVCPAGAVSVLGRTPGECTPLAGRYPGAERVETLIRGRRSVRRYRDENLEPALLQRLLEVALHAPSGMNARKVRFTVVDEREKMARLRGEVMAGLGRLRREGSFPEGLAFFAELVRMWEEEGTDVVFRGAPHLVVASAPRDVPTPLQDCLIALSYFELFAQANGVGTVWDGLAKWAVADLLPETRTRLAIPEDHLVGYVMAFGKPAVTYHRTVRHDGGGIVRPAL
jgi:nitroreductase/NAD-dependent dihydropyrimidine dehydrogenase PreA subunit